MSQEMKLNPPINDALISYVIPCFSGRNLIAEQIRIN